MDAALFGVIPSTNPLHYRIFRYAPWNALICPRPQVEVWLMADVATGSPDCMYHSLALKD